MGNQKWYGAAPSFISSAEIIRMVEIQEKMARSRPIKSRLEAIAWAKKYFNVASFSRLLDV